jgi:hypothetical protein
MTSGRMRSTSGAAAAATERFGGGIDAGGGSLRLLAPKKNRCNARTLCRIFVAVVGSALCTVSDSGECPESEVRCIGIGSLGGVQSGKSVEIGARREANHSQVGHLARIRAKVWRRFSASFAQRISDSGH